MKRPRARAYADVRDAGEFGVVVPSGARVEFAAVMERMRRLRAGLSRHDSMARFRDLGVDVFIGEGRFARSLVLLFLKSNETLSRFFPLHGAVEGIVVPHNDLTN